MKADVLSPRAVTCPGPAGQCHPWSTSTQGTGSPNQAYILLSFLHLCLYPSLFFISLYLYIISIYLCLHLYLCNCLYLFSLSLSISSLYLSISVSPSRSPCLLRMRTLCRIPRRTQIRPPPFPPSNLSGCVLCEELARIKTGTFIKGAYLHSARTIEETQKSWGLAADMSGQAWALAGGLSHPLEVSWQSCY